MKEYVPSFLSHERSNYPNQGSAWKGLEVLIAPIIRDFHICSFDALEFGVEGGYSTAALAEHFNCVTAVDHFRGDVYSGVKVDANALERETRKSLESWPNIVLLKDDCFSWIASRTTRHCYDLCHIDITHEYSETFAAGLWAVRHADVVLFHDTETYPEVKRACIALAAQTDCEAYNWPKNHGLGILVKK